MIGPGVQPLTIYLATRPVDFRKGHDGLSAIIQETFGRDPFSGAVFVFRSKRADRIKILVFDRTGLAGDCRPRNSQPYLKGSIGDLFAPSARVVRSLRDDRDELTRASVSAWRKRRGYDCLCAWISLRSRKKTPP